ncbi:sigma 54-interacting transcriptional regulator [Pseudomonas matsuisoli]|uniref:Sigma-54-dependent Fis family transcriptional regulator n=1 Tax=Pseudomonas matsuisoli TaxID=1515666 RepID=A0A917UR59_9PSED|nr:sigma 54-interacting transcriptional regulator [Pseudomonas matsuisoli]GGJ78745.1 sigma-54-dependent Fis family transcriptional regulator [Pseudomonas matsuisoli]
MEQMLRFARLGNSAEADGLDLETVASVAAPLNVDILLRGETGTGKDTLAEMIHSLSGRKGQFVAINCAAIPETLAESQLFGVTTGAFTGATQSRPGYIETANKGTLYLDEIDSMPLNLQAKLLRVLEARGVQRLGSTQFIPVDMNVIASAQNSLTEMVERGQFRQDLYFRINVVSIELPALRTRRERIAPLFISFIRREASELDRTTELPSPKLLQALVSYSWPGNVRELRSAAKRYVLGLNPLPHVESTRSSNRLKLKDNLEQFEKLLIEDCLRRHHRCINAAASELAISRRTLYHRMKYLNISRRDEEA